MGCSYEICKEKIFVETQNFASLLNNEFANQYAGEFFLIENSNLKKDFWMTFSEIVCNHFFGMKIKMP